MQTKSVFLAVVLASLPALCFADPVAPFGAASAYNLVALGSSTYAGNITVGSADSGGRIAAAGSITAPGGWSGFTVGSSIANDTYGSSADYAVVASSLSGNLYINGGGNTHISSVNGTLDFNDHGSNVTSGSSGLDFTSLRTSLENMSTQLAGITANGNVRPGSSALGENPSWTVLQGNVAGINYFTITAAQFASGTFDIKIPAGAPAIINVVGATSYTLGNAIYMNGTQYHGDGNQDANVLFNFASATSVNISAGLDASVLAPWALLTDNNGQIDGNFFAAQINLTGYAEAHNVEFTGSLPPSAISATPEPSSLALMGTGILSLAGFIRVRKTSEK